MGLGMGMVMRTCSGRENRKVVVVMGVGLVVAGLGVRVSRVAGNEGR